MDALGLDQGGDLVDPLQQLRVAGRDAPSDGGRLCVHRLLLREPRIIAETGDRPRFSVWRKKVVCPRFSTLLTAVGFELFDDACDFGGVEDGRIAYLQRLPVGARELLDLIGEADRL